MAADNSVGNFAQDLAITLGILQLNGSGEITPFKFTMNPSLIPDKLFKEVCDLQPHFNVLLDRISLDPEFLGTTLER